MVDIKRNNPDGLSAPPGNRYAHVVQWGNLVWIAGQTARDADGNPVGEGDARAQCDKVYDNLKVALGSVGGTFADVVKVTIYLTSEEHLSAARAAQNECWGDNPLPASTMVIVKALARPEYCVEIEAFAAIDNA